MKKTLSHEERERIELAYDLVKWYENLEATNNETFMPLFTDTHRYLVLKGGGGSGKSIFAGRKILERAITEPGHRFLVVRKVGRTLRESCFAQLLGQLADHYPESGYKANKTNMEINFPNGSEILFSGLDDVEKLKSIFDITGIWIEEASELLEGDFNQLDIRLRTVFPHYLQFIITFNPISATHWLKRRFFDLDIKDPKQRESFAGKVRTHESTYKDNRFLTKEAVEVLEAFKETDEYYYTVYCLGMWGVTGKSVFDGKAVTRRLQENIQPLRIGYFEYDDDGLKLSNIRWVDSKDGFIRMYADPEADAPYVIGGDTAGDGSDSFVAQVLDNRTGAQVCTLRHQFDEDLYARQVYCLATHYNTALVGIETNCSTYPVMELERLRYPKQYVRETVDNYTHSIRHSFGVRTDTKTRPVMISELIKAARDDISIVCDKTTLEEMLTFVRDEHFKPAAEEGAHDDCVMALAIAHYIRPQQNYTSTRKSGSEWTQEMWEDYGAASPTEKTRLIQRWGKSR